MFISVQFKNAKKQFVGKTYEYEICADEPDRPECGDVIRMMDENYNYICNGTRVKVVAVKKMSECPCRAIRFVRATMD